MLRILIFITLILFPLFFFAVEKEAKINPDDVQELMDQMGPGLQENYRMALDHYLWMVQQDYLATHLSCENEDLEGEEKIQISEKDLWLAYNAFFEQLKLDLSQEVTLNNQNYLDIATENQLLQDHILAKVKAADDCNWHAVSASFRYRRYFAEAYDNLYLRHPRKKGELTRDNFMHMRAHLDTRRNAQLRKMYHVNVGDYPIRYPEDPEDLIPLSPEEEKELEKAIRGELQNHSSTQ